MLRRLLALHLLVCVLVTACASAPTDTRVQIVHTNDLHGHVEKAAAIAAVAREARRRNPNTLFVDAGDCISGTPVSTVFKGRPIFEIMSAMGYDAVALGNHEFDHGWDHIQGFRELSQFPLLCANANGPDGKPLGDDASRVFDVGGVRVGVLALITEKVPGLTVRTASLGCTFEDPVEAARRLVPELRKRCDIVIALTHLGVEEDAALAGAVPGIDVIVGGHSHTELKTALEVEGTRIVQAKCYGERVGVIELTWSGAEKRVTDFTYRLVEIRPDEMPNDPKVKELVDTWEGEVDQQVSGVIGHTADRLSKKRLRPRIEHIYKELLGTDFGYQNMGGIRGTIEVGEIQIRHVWTVLPFDNTLVTLTLRGDQLPKFSRRQLGDAFDADAEYTIATNSYVGDHVDKYFGIESAPTKDSGRFMRDEVVRWVKEHGGFDPKGTPLDEDRDLEPGENR